MAVVAALAVTAAACGSDEPSSSDASDAVTTVAPAEETDGSTAPIDTTAPVGSDAPTDTDRADRHHYRRGGRRAFPVTIEHKFGETTIDAEPERVVSIGYNEHDFLLALGVVPVALRDWYGEQPNSVWPWAQDELGDATPEVLPSTDLNFEQIAALDPDLIVGVWSGMTAEDYELLSAIAPTVAQPENYDDYGTPWQEQTLILGAGHRPDGRGGSGRRRRRRPDHRRPRGTPRVGGSDVVGRVRDRGWSRRVRVAGHPQPVHAGSRLRHPGDQRLRRRQLVLPPAQRRGHHGARRRTCWSG